MSNPVPARHASVGTAGNLKAGLIVIVFAALAALCATFAVASLALELTMKVAIVASVVAVFLIISGGVYLQLIPRLIDAEPSANDSNLAVLDDANQYFAGSLSVDDTFRLLTSRTREMLPVSSIALWLWDEHGNFLPRCSAGLFDGTVPSQVEQAFSEGCIQIAERTAAIPLVKANSVVGVLQLGNDSYGFGQSHHGLFEAVASRVSPLILAAIAFERTSRNALTDVTTELPNERAFFLILENHVAGSQRERTERPLSILAIDVNEFGSINLKYGHAAGDRLLAFAAANIRDTLRQMDFLARSRDDEFLAVLPTASSEVSHEVIARIHTAFFGRKFPVNDTDSVEIAVNIGWAVFSEDGETADQLIKAARIRRDQAKSPEPPKVLWFPTESRGAAH